MRKITKIWPFLEALEKKIFILSKSIFWLLYNDSDNLIHNQQCFTVNKEIKWGIFRVVMLKITLQFLIKKYFYFELKLHLSFFL